METPLSGRGGKRALVRVVIVGTIGVALLAAVWRLLATRRDTAEVPAEVAKLIDIALGSDDEAERRAASRRLAELNRGALARVKRLRVVITTYSSPDVAVSLALPEAIKKLLAGSGIALADGAGGASDAVLRIHACCTPDWADYGIFVRRSYSGASVDGAFLVETNGRPPSVGTFSGKIHPPGRIRFLADRPELAPFEQALGKGLVLPLATLLKAKAVSPLLALLSDSNEREDVRETAAQALGQLKDQRALEPLMATLENVWFKGHDPALAEALAEVTDAPSVEHLLARLKKKDDAWIWPSAARVLGRLKEARALEPLTVALRDKDSNIRRLAVEALGALKDSRALEPLLAIVKDGDVFERIEAIKALGEIRDSRAVEPLIAALADQDWTVRQSTARVMGELKDPRAIGPLLAAVKDEDVLVRIAAIEALGKLKDPQTLDAFRAALKDDNVNVPLAAIEALGRLSDPRTSELLFGLAKDGSSPLGATAILALAKLSDPRAIGLLRSSLKGGCSGREVAALVRLELRSRLAGAR